MPSKTSRQRRFMGMALAAKRGKRPASPRAAKVARSMSVDQLRDFARKPVRKMKRNVTRRALRRSKRK
jgi:hypothetical protein